MRAYTHGGWADRQRVSTTFLTRGKTQTCSCAPEEMSLTLQPILLTTESDTTTYNAPHKVMNQALQPIVLLTNVSPALQPMVLLTNESVTTTYI